MWPPLQVDDVSKSWEDLEICHDLMRDTTTTKIGRTRWGHSCSLNFVVSFGRCCQKEKKRLIQHHKSKQSHLRTATKTPTVTCPLLPSFASTIFRPCIHHTYACSATTIDLHNSSRGRTIHFLTGRICCVQSRRSQTRISFRAHAVQQCIVLHEIKPAAAAIRPCRPSVDSRWLSSSFPPRQIQSSQRARTGMLTSRGFLTHLGRRGPERNKT
jgi:hypothetical protein